MPDGMVASLWDWIRSGGVVVLVAGYLIVTAVTLLALIGVLAALPPDYFRDGAPSRPARPRASLLARIARNAAGLVLIVLGLLLSLPLVPGQGLLTLLIGLILVDVPGKRRVERRLVARPGVLETLNRIRRWLGRPPFAAP